LNIIIVLLLVIAAALIYPQIVSYREKRTGAAEEKIRDRLEMCRDILQYEQTAARLKDPHMLETISSDSHNKMKAEYCTKEVLEALKPFAPQQ
jgi:hypothetical protein